MKTFMWSKKKKHSPGAGIAIGAPQLKKAPSSSSLPQDGIPQRSSADHPASGATVSPLQKADSLLAESNTIKAFAGESATTAKAVASSKGATRFCASGTAAGAKNPEHTQLALFSDNIEWLLNMEELKQSMSVDQRRVMVLNRGKELLRAGYRTEKVRFELETDVAEEEDTDDKDGRDRTGKTDEGVPAASAMKGSRKLKRGQSVSITCDAPTAKPRTHSAADGSSPLVPRIADSSDPKAESDSEEDVPIEFASDADSDLDVPIVFESDEGSDAEQKIQFSSDAGSDADGTSTAPTLSSNVAYEAAEPFMFDSDEGSDDDDAVAPIVADEREPAVEIPTAYEDQESVAAPLETKTSAIELQEDLEDSAESPKGRLAKSDGAGPDRRNMPAFVPTESVVQMQSTLNKAPKRKGRRLAHSEANKVHGRERRNAMDVAGNREPAAATTLRKLLSDEEETPVDEPKPKRRKKRHMLFRKADGKRASKKLKAIDITEEPGDALPPTAAPEPPPPPPLKPSVVYELTHSKESVAEFEIMLAAAEKELDSDTEELDEGISDTGQWVQRFQQALTVIRSCGLNTVADELTKAYADMSSLAQDFLHCAQTYGKIIISERFLPDNQRTIRPKELGGVAGGEKYIVNNVLFKFAVDSHGLLGSDYAAAKIAGNELKGLISYFNCSLIEIHLPLMALVDYKGFRLVAMSLLPIGKNTLKYGTHDAGLTLVNSDTQLDALMKLAAKRININSHLCGLEKGGDGVVLHSAADVEGHRGTDGQYYLLDFARTMPPETPDPNVKGGHLFRLLRPEFVKSYHTALCSDAFSGFMLADPKARKYNQEIKEATDHLKNKVIPQHMRSLTWQIMEAKEKGALERFHLPEAIHSKGIGMRHIGLLLSHLRDAEQFHEVRVLLVLEAIARAVKNKLRAKLRKKMQKLKQPLEAPYRKLVINFMNLVFGVTRRSDLFWNTVLKNELITNFSMADPIVMKDFKLKSILTKWRTPHLIPYSLLFNRIAQLTGLRFSPIAKRKVVLPRLEVVSRVAYPFDDTDLDSIGERVKHLNIVAEALGSYYHHKGLESRMLDDKEGARELLNVAIQKYEEALASNPTSQDLLRNTALCLTRLIELDLEERDAKQFSMSDSMVQKAEQYYIRAINEATEDSLSLYSYAKFLWKCSRTERAEEYFLQSLEAQPNFTWSLRDYSRFLESIGCSTASASFMMQYRSLTVAGGDGRKTHTVSLRSSQPT